MAAEEHHAVEAASHREAEEEGVSHAVAQEGEAHLEAVSPAEDAANLLRYWRWASLFMY